MNHLIVKRPWGSFTRFTNNELSTVKLLYIDKGEEFSLQYHTHRTEFWKILKGNPEIIMGDKTEHSKEGDEFTIEPHINHRIYAPVDDVVVLEISTGQFDEEDLVRIEDKYNRE
ncbi:MAG: cupin domain-containing protein [bacterium]|nr:cupin domain-containing protein [bacterium]